MNLDKGSPFHIQETICRLVLKERSELVRATIVLISALVSEVISFRG